MIINKVGRPFDTNSQNLQVSKNEGTLPTAIVPFPAASTASKPVVVVVVADVSTESVAQKGEVATMA